MSIEEIKVKEAIEILALSPYVDERSRDAAKVVCQKVYSLLSDLEKERERADKAEKRLEDERISVNELSLANQELELQLHNLKEAVEKRRDFIPDIESPTLPEDIEQADEEPYKVLEESEKE